MSSENNDSSNTTNIIILSITMLILGFFFFLFKVEACKKTVEKDICKEEFVEIKQNNSYNQDHKCTPGATVEIVTSPPAPKAGIICRCNKELNAAPANSYLFRGQ